MGSKPFGGLVVAVVALLAGCGGGEDSTRGSGLVPADEIEAETNQTGQVGAGVVMDDGLVVHVGAIEAHPDYSAGEPWQATHLVSVRVENPTERELQAPVVGIHCEGVGERGGWYRASTFEPYKPLPAGTFHEGVLHLAVPEDADGVAQQCLGPIVRFSANEWTGVEPRDLDYRLADFVP